MLTMRNEAQLLVLFPTTIALLFCRPAQALTLVEDGKPRATIVVAASALAPVAGDTVSGKVAVAARDLQDYVHKISGATLPISGDNQEIRGNVILVGKSLFTSARNLVVPGGLTPARKEEGFVIRSSANWLALAGNDDGPYHGTEYAVYDFLDRQGVRWFMPGEFGEYVPARKSIVMGEVNIAQRPDFIQRNWWSQSNTELSALQRKWKIRNKMNPDNMFAIPTDGSLRKFLAAPELADTKPELFARRFDGSLNLHYPNLSNPETVQIAAEKMKEFFRKNPKAGSVGMAPDDGRPRDFNGETVKRNQGFSDLSGREGVASEMSTTEEWLEWVNAVAREVRKEFPDRIITTNGYATRNMAPFGVDIEPNVSIMFGAIWSDTLHAYDDRKSWQMERQGQLLKQWCSLSDKVWIYGYDYAMLVSALTPLPQARKFQRDMPLLKQWGVVGFMDETRDVWMERGIGARYVKARLEWDVNADVDALLDDFFGKWYGPAAKPSRAFWDCLETAIETSPITGHEDRVLPWLYTPQLMTKLAKHLNSAEKVAVSPRHKLHVQVDRLIFQHLQEYVAMNAADLAGDYAEAARRADAMLLVRPKLHAINPFLTKPNERKDNGTIDHTSGVWYWSVTDRASHYRKLAGMQSGTTGTLVAALPSQAMFSTDPEDEGRFAGWFREDWPVHSWHAVTTTKPFYLQGYLARNGRPYLGKMWYRFQVKIPDSARGQQVLLHAPVVEAEAWTWVNGKYVGHRRYRETYERPNSMELDVTSAIRPGAVNTVTIRVSTGANPTELAGGLTSRLFLFSPVK